MSEVFELLKDIYADLGVLGLVVGAFVLGCYFLGFTAGKHFFLRVAEKMSITWGKVSDPIPCRKIDNIIKYGILKVNIKCPLRREIFKDILKIKFSNTLENFRFSYTNKVKQLNREEFRLFIIGLVEQIHSQWISKAKESEIPNVAIEKFIAMNSPKYLLLKSIAYEIADSEAVYPNNKAKLLGMMGITAAMYETSLLDAEKTIDQLNGDLSRSTYKGKSCTVCTDKCKHLVAKEK